MGPEDLAREVECSQRTIFRDIEILSAAGIPVYFDKSVQAYRGTDGCRLGSLVPEQVAPGAARDLTATDLLRSARSLIESSEVFLARLRTLCDELEAVRRTT